MATTKKTPTSKKKLIPAKARPVTWKFYVVSIGIFLVAVTSVIVIGLLAAHSIASHQANARYDRINDIYTAIKLDDSYSLESKNIFGDKRLFATDDKRTHSSEMTYTKGATVQQTVTELDNKIKASGFEFVEQPYPGSFAPVYDYKSDKGEYLRLRVSSKPYFDAVKNTLLMKNEFTKDLMALDKNAGPSNVSIKVNLDDKIE
jgi:hypothetical protein